MSCYFWLDELKTSGMTLGKVEVGVEGSIGPLLLKAQDSYSNRGKFQGFYGLFGEDTCFDTMICGNGYVSSDLLVMVVRA